MPTEASGLSLQLLAPAGKRYFKQSTLHLGTWRFEQKDAKAG